MRLRRLDLTRYGKFTDFVLDFGEVAPGEADFHVIYGPNEAGKSTLLAGFLDLLFSMGKQNRYNFRHPYPTMRVGAALEFPGGVVELARIKRDQNDLLDAGGQPVPELVITGQLGGIDRDKYRAMFSLDDETLEKGGDSILASRGDLGELLFAASAGLADLSETLRALKEEADGFTRLHGRSTRLAALKEELATLRRDRDAIDTAAGAYAQLKEARDSTLARYQAAMAERGTLLARMEEIRRLLGCLPRLAALRRLRERLAPLAGLPEAPAGWFAELPALRDAEIELGERARAIGEEIGRHQAALASIEVDEAALLVADRVDGWSAVQARAETALVDIPLRLAEVAAQERSIAHVLVRIGQEGGDPGGLVLPVAIVGKLRALIESRSGIEQAVEQAGAEMAEGTRRQAAAAARLREAGGSGEALSEAARSGLVAAVAAARAADHGTRRRLAAQAGAECRDELADRMVALLPWTGDAEALLALPVPGQSALAGWKSALAAAQREHGARAAAFEELARQLRQRRAERDALAAGTGLVSEQDAAALRVARDAAWMAHRAALDAATADRFEAAMRQDDQVTQAMIGHAGDRGVLQRLDADIARTRVEADDASAALERAAVGLREITTAIGAAAPGGLELPALEEWLARREQALDVRTRLRRAERELAAADEDAAGAQASLVAALVAAGVTAGEDAVEALLSRAQAALERDRDGRELRAALGEREREVAARAVLLDAARAQDTVWQAAWAAACSACWLGDRGVPSLAVVRETLTALGELERAVEQRDGLLRRVEQMRDDQAQFAALVGEVARVVGCEAEPGAALEAAARIARRMAAARDAGKRRAALVEALADAGRRQAAVAAREAALAVRRDGFTGFFGVASLAEVDLALQGVRQRAELTAQAREAEAEILDALPVADMAAAEAVLDQADRVALEAELAGLKVRFEDQDRLVHELFSEHRKAADAVELVGGDGAVARLEAQRRTVMLEIEDRALRWLRLRVGVAAAELALRAYRQAHRSSMLARASAAFRTMSRGAYQGLEAQPQGSSELLVAVAADGGSKPAAALSKGTRFQLYLALRVAGYHEYARHRVPVPFIADDIMETFDDDRSAETMRLFGEMSGVGQVIYLTHHAHLCEIARRACPGVRVHAIG